MLQLLIFGTGKGAGKMIGSMDPSKYHVLAYIDNNRSKQRKEFEGKPIISPSEIHTYDYDKIIICSTSHKEIKAQLENELNISASVIANSSYFAESEFMDYYEELEKKGELCEEKRKVLQHIKKHGLEVFNYPFSHDYDNFAVEVMKDETFDRYYVVHKGTKVYFKKGLSIDEIIDFYKSIIKEQDKDSPHRYLKEEFAVNEGDVVIDAGTAEGLFSLEIIDKVKKLYIVETDIEWIEALKCTFAPWKDKVVLINQFLTDFCDESHTTIDSFIQDEQVNFIKMDIEGSECSALQGARQTIANGKHVRVDICAYHSHDDEQKIRSLLIQYGFIVSASKGYMVFIYNKSEPYRLVKGLVRGEK